jgi:GalNAc-alpha-(1->4)-GalNAc-alpha-(1->3)-diNAcBac-PP-undecaprenol alpha-1,4-N-acetyl-D-galactosaminyltransferase
MQKNILLFYPSFEKGGATKNLINIVNYLIKKKIKIILFSYNAKKNYFTKNNNLRIVKINPINKINFIPIRWNITISAMIKLHSFLKKKKKSLIFSMQNHIASIIVAKINNSRIIIRNSEEPFGATRYADNKFLALIVLMLKCIFYNFSDKIIAISIMSKRSLNIITFFRKKIILIYNPYLKKILHIKKKKYKRDFTILSVGRLCKQKNFIILINAIKNLKTKYKNIKLVIIGSGPLESRLKSSIMNSKNIRIIKWRKNLHKYYLKADLFVLPSYYEGLSNALIDAVNYQVPCIASNCSGSNDILANGRGGYIFNINNQSQLQNKIEIILNNHSYAIKKTYYAKKFINRFTHKNLLTFYKVLN